MVLFLRDWGTSAVAALVIPVTVLVTFIALKVMGESFNLMTLGGLAAAVGLVIDDAIVVVENIALHRDAGQGRVEAIHSALREITAPLVGSTITPIVVFLPLIAITGVTGVFFRALAITVGVSLLTSLALGSHLDADAEPVLPSQERSSTVPVDDSLSEKDRLLAAEEAALSGRFRRVVDFYERWLRFALERPRLDRHLCSCAGGGFLLLLSRRWAPTCFRRWTKAASCSTTSRPQERRWQKPTA